MVTNRVIWITIFIIFSHPCEVNDLMDGVMMDVGVDMYIILMAPPATIFESVVGAAEITSVVSDTGAEGLAAGATPSQFTLSAPREDRMPFCSASFAR